MTKGNKYSLAAMVLVSLSGLALYLLVGYEKAGNGFYSTCGVVYFTQYFLLSSGGLALTLSGVGAWRELVAPINASSLLRLTVISLPLLILSSLIAYAALLFTCLI